MRKWKVKLPGGHTFELESDDPGRVLLERGLTSFALEEITPPPIVPVEAVAQEGKLTLSVQEAAEAVALDKGGEPLYLDTYELQQAAKQEQEAYREVDPWEGAILDFVEEPVPVDWDEWPVDRRRIYWDGNIQGAEPETRERDRICAQEVWVEAMGKRLEDMTQMDARRINSILAAMPGWEKKGQMPPSNPYGRQRAFTRIKR